MYVDLTQNPKWVQRCLSFFDNADSKKSGLLNINDILEWGDLVKEHCTESELVVFKNRLREFYTALGVTSSGTRREDWAAAVNRFANAERERRANGRRTMYEDLCDAFFDIFDKDKNGVITLNELIMRMKAFGMPESSAYAFMEFADTNKNGVLERSEIYEVDFEYWFGSIDPKYDDLYGDVYKGDDMADADFTKNVKWVRRVLTFFDLADKEGKGAIYLDDIVKTCDRLKEFCHPTEQEFNLYKQRAVEFYSALGVTSAGTKREDWPAAVNRFAKAERGRKKRGEKTMYEALSDSLFDILDQDKNNVITLNELKVRMNVFRMPEDAARVFMEYADVNKNGVLERNEMYEADFNFWFGFDPALDNLYGDWYRGEEVKDLDLLNNPKWVQRTLGYFDNADQEKTGVLTMRQVLGWCDELKKYCNPSKAELKAYRNASKEFFSALGVSSMGTKRADWPAAVARFANAEQKRKRKGQTTLYQMLSDALFDIIDQDKNGVVTLDELKIRNKIFGMSEKSAVPFMELADTNKNGVLERKELYDIDFDFWFGAPDEKLDNLYGEMYRGEAFKEIDLLSCPKWVKRTLMFFDHADKNKSGVVTLPQLLESADMLKQACRPSEKELELYKDRLVEFYAYMGITTTGTRREDWPAVIARFAESERHKRRTGQTTMYEMVSNALFDIIDKDKNGVITIEELKLRMKAFSMPVEAAYDFMEFSDTDKSGSLSRQEFYEMDFNFWFGSIDPALDQLYGKWYNGTQNEDIDLTQNPKWVNRVYSYFDNVDVNKTGVMKMSDHLGLIKELERCKPTRAELERYTTAMIDFYLGLGVTYDGTRREDMPALVNKFAREERARKNRGEVTLYQKMSDALFDILDTDKNGIVTMNELVVRMKAFGMPERAAQAFMDFADTNHNGVLERSEMYEADFNFWFGDIDDTYDELYGDVYRGFELEDNDLTKNPRWVKRVTTYFDLNDHEKKGIITLDDILKSADLLKEVANPTDYELQTYKDRMIEFYSAMGYTSGGLRREDAPAAINRFAQAERERKKKGQVTLHQTLSDALFDILDKDKNNVITMNELEIRMKAFGMPVSAARHFMNFADTNKNGVLERSEMYEYDFNFWFGTVDAAYDTLYGGLF